MKETFKVIKVDSNKVEMIRLNGEYGEDCSKCVLSNICHRSTGNDKILKLNKDDLNFDLKKEDIVEIEPPRWLVTKISFFVYVVPLIIFLLSALLSYSILKDEKISFYISVFSLALSAFLIKLLERTILRKTMNKFKVRKRKYDE